MTQRFCPTHQGQFLIFKGNVEAMVSEEHDIFFLRGILNLPMDKSKGF